MTDDELDRLVNAFRREIEGATTRFESTAARLTAENRQHFDVAAESLRSDVRLVAEGVAHLDGRLGREAERLDQKIDRGFADTQAMIRFSHAELERRVRALEQGVADLHLRVEKLEDPATH